MKGMPAGVVIIFLLSSCVCQSGSAASNFIAGVQAIGTSILPNAGISQAGVIDLRAEYPRASVVDPSGDYIILANGDRRGRIVKVDLNFSPPKRVDDLLLGFDESACKVAVIDPDGVFAYFALSGSIPRIVKIRTSDLTRVATLNLQAADGLILSGAIDPDGGYAYFGTSLSPGRVVKINLATFTRANTLNLSSGENAASSMAMDSAGNFAYVGTSSFPARVVKIDLSTFTRESAIVLPAGEFGLSVALVDPADTFLYFGCTVSPAAIIKIRLSNFTREGSISLAENQSVWSGVMDPTGFFAYFGIHDHSDGSAKIEKVSLSSFAVIDELLLGTHQNAYPQTGTIRTDGVFAYFGVEGSDAGSLIPISLGTFFAFSPLTFAPAMESAYHGAIDASGHRAYYVDEVISGPFRFIEVDLVNQVRTRGLILPHAQSSAPRVMLSPNGQYAYITYGTGLTTGCVLLEIDLITFTAKRSVQMNNDETFSYHGVIEPQGRYAFINAYPNGSPSSAKVIRIDLNTMQRVDALPLSYRAIGVVMDPQGQYAYFTENSNPPKIERINLTNFTFGGGLQLLAGESPYTALAIDPVGQFLYYGTNTTPGQIVKINLSTFQRIGKITIAPDETAVLSAAVESSGRYGFFSSLVFSGPPALVKIDLATFTRMGAAPFGSYFLHADRQGDYLYQTAGHEIQRISLNSRGLTRATKFNLPQTGKIETVNFHSHASIGMQRREAQPLMWGQFQPLCSIMDSVRKVGYVGVQGAPGQIVRFDLNTFEQTATLAFQDNFEADPTCGFLDPSGTFAYFGCFSGPGKVVKIRVSDFTQVDTLTFGPGENNIACGAMDPAGDFAYFGCNTSPPQIVKVRLSDFSRVEAITLEVNEGPLRTAFVSPDGANAYFGTYTAPGKVVQINLSTFSRAGVLTFNSDENLTTSSVVASGGLFAYFGTGDTPGKVVKVRLSDFTRMDGIPMNEGEDDLTCAVIHPNSKFALFGSSTGKVIKIDLTTFARIDSTPLFAADGVPAAAMMDDQGAFAWIGCAGTPAKLVKIEASPNPLRLGLFRSSPGSLARVWQSAALPVNQANSTISVPISSGSPAALELTSGDYYLAWQLDSDVNAASHVPGAAEDGIQIPMPFGNYPVNLWFLYVNAGIANASQWTSYITYSIQTSVKKWEAFR